MLEQMLSTWTRGYNALQGTRGLSDELRKELGEGWKNILQIRDRKTKVEWRKRIPVLNGKAHQFQVVVSSDL
jgi:hypothetical protein